MTDNEMRIATAEECGWKRNPLYDIPNPQSATTIPRSKIGYEAWVEPITGRLVWPIELPDYPNDLNAMHEVEASLTEQEQMKYAHMLLWHIGSKIVSMNQALECTATSQIFEQSFRFVHATAHQRCEAFLRVKGKWKE